MAISNRQKKGLQAANYVKLAYGAIKQILENAADEKETRFPFTFDSFNDEVSIEERELLAEIKDLQSLKENLYPVWQALQGYAIRDNYTID